MEGWIKIQKRYKLLQKRSSSAVWETQEPIFCDLTKKQTPSGFVVAVNGMIIGIYDFASFYSISEELLSKHEYIHTRLITSSAAPVKHTIRKERAKLSPALRYKILKRDKFRCRACGARAGDVELQIDHITPVSKGGKTIESNLQTLCRECNYGKSNRY